MYATIPQVLTTDLNKRCKIIVKKLNNIVNNQILTDEGVMHLPLSGITKI